MWQPKPPRRDRTGGARRERAGGARREGAGTATRILIGAGVVVLIGLLAGVWWVWPEKEGEGVRATLSATAALAGSDTAGYARATEPRAFEFPQDHGPHPEYRTEWWYLTGNLEDTRGRRFGYQLTFFRNSLAPEPPGGRSRWSTNQLWMAHLGLTDVEGGAHLSAERMARGAAGLAGGVSEPFRVWLEDWEIRHILSAESAEPGAKGEAGTNETAEAEGLFPLLLTAREGDVELRLELTSSRPPVFQGEAGLSQKGPDPGNASYYISFTRLPTRGTVRVGDQVFQVAGDSWMDREWSTSALDEIHEGWDWFSLQLDDGRDLMFFELRRADGRVEPLNHGVLVEPDGSYRILGAEEVELEVLDRWDSPLDGASYPSGWRMRIPSHGVDLVIEPLLRNQEVNLSIRYWEGAVEAWGDGPDGSVRGRGFVELTGYGELPADAPEARPATEGSGRSGWR